MMNQFKKELIEKITKAARNAFTKIIKEKSTENFFAFSLLTFDDVLCCYAYANSNESYFRTIKACVNPSSSDQKHHKWTPQEWEYNCIDKEEFNDIYNYSEKLLKDINSDEFYQYKLDFIDCMEKAMSKLDKEGIFGKRNNREEVTLFLTVSDSFMQEEVEEQSAKRLNSLIVYEKFKNR